MPVAKKPILLGLYNNPIKNTHHYCATTQNNAPFWFYNYPSIQQVQVFFMACFF
jgi:hypothetical protein